MKGRKAEYEFLDCAKGIAMFWIVAGHIYGHISIKVIDQIQSYVTMCYIALFFLVSGYLYSDLHSKNENLRKYIIHRCKRLLFPYFKYSVILLFIYLIIDPDNRNFHFIFINLIGILYSRKCLFYPWSAPNNIILMSGESGPMWFLTAMTLTSIIYICLRKYIFLTKINYIFSLIFSFALSMASSQLPLLLPWSIDVVPIFVQFCCIGELLNKYKLFERIKICNCILLFLVYSILIHINSNINISVREYGKEVIVSPIFYFLIGVLGSYFVICIARGGVNRVPILGDFCRLCGGSYSIFILSFHLIVWRMLNSVIVLSDINEYMKLLVVCMVIFMTIIIKFFVDNISKWYKLNMQ